MNRLNILVTSKFQKGGFGQSEKLLHYLTRFYEKQKRKQNSKKRKKILQNMIICNRVFSRALLFVQKAIEKQRKKGSTILFFL